MLPLKCHCAVVLYPFLDFHLPVHGKGRTAKAGLCRLRRRLATTVFGGLRCVALSAARILFAAGTCAIGGTGREIIKFFSRTVHHLTSVCAVPPLLQHERPKA